MENVPCKPYEEAADEHTMLNPFKALSTSILGQQVSWLAAKAITYKFIRLFFPDLPEKQEPGAPSPPFPTPAQVIACPYATLRTAGLSGRKAEYVLDISARFADGRLSAEKLLDMSDQEVYDALIQVRGIGPWSVEMFSMFVLRRPNVLSPGDLGLQKGLLTWFGQDSPQIRESLLLRLRGAPRQGLIRSCDTCSPCEDGQAAARTRGDASTVRRWSQATDRVPHHTQSWYRERWLGYSEAPRGARTGAAIPRVEDADSREAERESEQEDQRQPIPNRRRGAPLT